MPKGEKQKKGFWGPWRGINENPGECGPDQFEDAYNVELDGNVIRTLGGHEPLGAWNPGELTKVYPVAFWRFGDVGAAGLRSDYTAYCTDTYVGTAASLSGLMSNLATDKLYLGFLQPVSALTFAVAQLNAAASVIATSRYWSAATGWTTFAVFVDGTINPATPGVSLSQNGDMTWSPPGDWSACELPDQGAAGAAPPRSWGKLYWIELTWTAQLTTPCSIGELQGKHRSAVTLWPNINGIYTWRTKGGERLLILGLDDTQKGIGGLYVFERGTNRLRPFLVSAEHMRSGPDARWVFASTGEALIVGNGYTFLYATPDDPYRLRPFQPIPLKSTASYTTSPPSAARFIALTYDARIAVVDPAQPNAVRQSWPIDHNYDIKSAAYAPLGGWHIWDPVKFTDLFVDGSGSPITGIAQAGFKLVVFTGTSTHVFFSDGSKTVADAGVGCIAPASIAVERGGVFFLGTGPKVYVHKDGQNTAVSDAIDPTMQNLNRYGLHRSIGAVYRRKRQYWLWVPEDQTNQNSLGLIYHYSGEGWTKQGQVPFCAAVPVARVCAAYTSADDARDEDFFVAMEEDDTNQGKFVLMDRGVNPAGAVAMVVFDKWKLDEAQDPATLRFVRVQAKTWGGAGTAAAKLQALDVMVLRDGAAWKRGDGTYPLNAILAASLSLLDPAESTAANQVFADNVTVIGARIGVDAWRDVRWQSLRASVGLTARVFQVGLWAIHPGIECRGFELTFTPREGPR